MSKQNRPRYLVSTDSIGFLGNPGQFLYLWQEYFDNKTLDGVEVIAFKPLWRLNKLVTILKKNNIPVLEFHGKTGGENQLNLSGKIIMTLVNLGIYNVKFLLERFPEIEFLSHAPYFKKNLTKQIIFQQQPKKIWIENHLSGKRGIEDAIKAVEFINPKISIPMHYNTFPVIEADPNLLKNELEKLGKNCKVLNFGETIEV